jgi:hypothetical protein
MLRYNLVTKLIPEVKGKNIIKDYGVGGIKLTYAVGDRYFTPITKPNPRIHYIKLFKKHFANSKDEVVKGEWGNTNSPYSNVWMESKIEYDNFEKVYSQVTSTNSKVRERAIDFIVDLKKVTDPELIKHLNNMDQMFTMGESNVPKKLTFFKNVLVYVYLKFKN